MRKFKVRIIVLGSAILVLFLFWFFENQSNNIEKQVYYIAKMFAPNEEFIIEKEIYAGSTIKIMTPSGCYFDLSYGSTLIKTREFKNNEVSLIGKSGESFRVSLISISEKRCHAKIFIYSTRE